MAKTIENLFAILHFSVNALIIILFVSFYGKVKREKVFIAITLYCLLESVLNLTSKYVGLSFALTQYIWASFTFIEYLTFTLVIWASIKNGTIKTVIAYTSVAFILFTTIYNFATNFRSIDSIPIGVETILILVFCFYYLYEQMNDTVSLFIYSKYQFWIVVGIMIYLAGSFFIFILGNVLDERLLVEYWFVTNIFYTIMISLFGISFFVYDKANKTTVHKNLRPYLN
jgi:hypothetical protein